MKRKISVSDIALIFTIILTIFMGVMYILLWDIMENDFRLIFLVILLVMGIIILNGIKHNVIKSKNKNK